mmetsp:Transcript_68769/g.222180  ORF Transcript_68769/g.222180 Transcript_68769/m.222180 type:complete len:206 (+) Transcript_68769:786-1403(+)
MPRFTRARMPGSKALPPSRSARSMSIVPVTRSSVAPSGSSTKGVRFITTGKSSPAARRSRTSSLMADGSRGSELYLSSPTIGMSGSSRTNARTAVDLPVPRSPWIMTPPMTGSTKFSSSAVFISCWPTTAENGNALMPKSWALPGLSPPASRATGRRRKLLRCPPRLRTEAEAAARPVPIAAPAAWCHPMCSARVEAAGRATAVR